tara:strand:+ start:2032 stop:2289 length:258 start_codon:yes stop_codon:yes gene_type:complete
MGYCATCNEWCGYSTSFCENKKCELTRKLIGLYGIDKVGDCLAKVFVREDKAIGNRTDNIDKLETEKTDKAKKDMVLRSDKKARS